MARRRVRDETTTRACDHCDGSGRVEVPKPLKTGEVRYLTYDGRMDACIFAIKDGRPPAILWEQVETFLRTHPWSPVADDYADCCEYHQCAGDPDVACSVDAGDNLPLPGVT